MVTVDGFELQFGSNFLGPFALTNLLLPLCSAAGPRVVTMSSVAANWGRIHFDDLQYTRRRYRGDLAYAQSKLASMLVGLHLAEVAKSKQLGSAIHAAHPGYTRTNLQTTGANLGRDKPRAALGDHALDPLAGGRGWHRATAVRGHQSRCRAGRLLRAHRAAGTGRTTIRRGSRGRTGIDLAASLWSVAEDLTHTSISDVVASCARLGVEADRGRARRSPLPGPAPGPGRRRSRSWGSRRAAGGSA